MRGLFVTTMRFSGRKSRHCGPYVQGSNRFRRLFVSGCSHVLLDTLLRGNHTSCTSLTHGIGLSTPTITRHITGLRTYKIVANCRTGISVSGVNLPVRYIVRLHLGRRNGRGACSSLVGVPRLARYRQIANSPYIVVRTTIKSVPRLRRLVGQVTGFNFDGASVILSDTVRGHIPLKRLRKE